MDSSTIDTKDISDTASDELSVTHSQRRAKANVAISLTGEESKRDEPKTTLSLWQCRPSILSWKTLTLQQSRVLLQRASDLTSGGSPEETKRARAYVSKVFRSSECVADYDYINDIIDQKRLVCNKTTPVMFQMSYSTEDIIDVLSYSARSDKSSSKNLENEDISNCLCYRCGMVYHHSKDDAVVMALMNFIGFGEENSSDYESFLKIINLVLAEEDSTLAKTELCAAQMRQSDINHLLEGIVNMLAECIATESSRAITLLAELHQKNLIHEDPVANNEKCRQLLLAACIKGNRSAMYRLAKLLESDGSHEKAIEWIKEAAAKDHPKAIYELALYFLSLKDFDSALPMFIKAASKGVSEAYDKIDTIYSGELDEHLRDSVQRMRWRLQAALEGLPSFQVLIGEEIFVNAQINTTGKDDMDIAMENSFAWFERAALQGNSKAMLQLASSYSNGTLSAKKDLEKSFYWAEKAASYDLSDAFLLLGHFYFSGLGVEADKKTAVKYILRAADEGMAKALYMLSQLHRIETAEEFGLPFDLEASIDLLKKSAKKDYAEAQYMLGQHYLQEDDMERAFIWFRRAAMRDHVKAMHNVAIFYQQGWGTDQHIGASYIWMTKAASKGHGDAVKALDVYRENKELQMLVEFHQQLLSMFELHPTLHGVYKPA